MSDETQFEADVADLARQLENTDFSSASKVKESLRAKLLQQAKPRRKFSPVYSLAGLAAALLLVLIVVISVPPSPGMATATTKLILTATVTAAPAAIEQTQEVVVPTNLPNNETGGFLATIPEGYVLLSTLLEPENPSRLINIYYQHERWQEAVQAGNPYADTVDYLYISLQTDWELPEADAGTLVPANTIVPPPAEVFASSSTFYDPIEEAGQLIFMASGEGTLKDGRKVHYASRMSDNSLVQVWSFHLDKATLRMMLDRKTKQSELGLVVDDAFTFENSPYSCQDSQPIIPDGSAWQVPMKAGTYSLAAEFSNFHSGIDLVASTGTGVFAARGGKVIFAGESTDGYGLMVVVAHGDAYSMYAHLNAIVVLCGEEVYAGRALGIVGTTGNTSGPHLHFEIIDAQGIRVDPTTLLDF